MITLAKKRYDFPEQGGIFIDLGSGTGKAMLAAALTHKFDKVEGIECIKALYDEAEKLRVGYEFKSGIKN